MLFEIESQRTRETGSILVFGLEANEATGLPRLPLRASSETI
jgi:hypothetical protein